MPDPRKYDGIVHARSLTDKPQASSFAQAQRAGFYSLLALARACGARREIKLFVLSNHAQEVSGAEPLSPEKSTVLGPCTVIRQEYPNIVVKSIDVDCADEATAELVLGELAEPAGEVFVAYRNRQRWVQSYEPFAPAPPARSRFRAGGVYLITGGFGTVGGAIAAYLTQKYAAKLVLVGRSGLRHQQPRENILCLKADVADARAMREVVAQCYERFGALHGVIHGAGIVGAAGSREIDDSDPENCEPHFQAKAHGVLALEQALEGRALDFCLLLSSLTSVLGGIGQAAYSAANLYMDTFARRHNRCGARWLSVNWDVWRLGDERVEPGAGTTLRDLGMSASEAMQTMETVLALPRASQIVVSTGDLNARIEQWVKLQSLQIPSSQGPKRKAGRDAPRDDTESRIRRIWQDALGIDEIGIHDSFGELGGHSLLAIRIVAGLRRAFDIDLPVRALFDAPTIAQLSRYIEERVIAEVAALTDEQAARLVSNA
jgi:acyl carrier protein